MGPIGVIYENGEVMTSNHIWNVLGWEQRGMRATLTDLIVPIAGSYWVPANNFGLFWRLLGSRIGDVTAYE